MIHDEIVIRQGRGRRSAHDCERLSLTDEDRLSWEDVGTVVACPECGRWWKVVASLRLDFKRRPGWSRKRLRRAVRRANPKS